MDQSSNFVKFLLIACLSLFAISLSIDSADARRFGGGATFGKMSRATPSPASARPAGTAPQTAPAAAGAKRFMGPMAGLLAGGLLASLLLGGGFEHIRLLDIAIILLLLGFVLALLRRRQMIAAIQQKQQTNANAFSNSATLTPESSFSALNAIEVPSWFDKNAFLKGARQHFYDLQAAWDQNNFSLIQDYVTPELYNLLRSERAQHPNDNLTEVIELHVELLSVNDYGEQAEANVLFYGNVRENGNASPFRENWHLTRMMRNQEPWYIQGIEQH